MTRSVDPAAQAIRERRVATMEIAMLWLEGRNRETLVTEGVGMWGGADHATIAVVDLFTGVRSNRLFYGRGELLGVGDVQYEAGLNVRDVVVTLSGLGAAAEQAIRGYEPRGARAQLWRRVYDPASMKPVAAEAWFKGFVNEAPISRPAPGNEATIEVRLVSTAMMLTVASASKKSDAAQRDRAAGDTFRAHKAVTAGWTVPWGSRDERIGR